MVITREFAFLCTPRTASRACKEALLSIAGLRPRVTKYHHPKPQEVRANLQKDLPVYAMIRNPLTQVLSWFYHAQKGGNEQEFVEFIKNYSNGWLLSNRLNIYENVPDINIEYFVYEDGLESMLEKLGYPNVSVANIGATYPNYNLLTEQATELIQERWPLDVDLYCKVRNSTTE